MTPSGFKHRIMDFNYYDTTRIKTNVSVAESATARSVILFAQQNSIYKEFNTDIWDIIRDAKKWPGGEPIIAHPPCRAWGNYSHKAKPRPGEKELAIWAIEQVREWGGIVEHPASSKLWKTIGATTKPDLYGGWILNIDQHWFGHRAIKRTNLYIVGCKPKEIPPIPLKLRQTTTTVERMGKKEREKTPKDLAEWLIKLIFVIKQNIL